MMAGTHLAVVVVFFLCAAVAADSTEGSSQNAASDGFCEAGENCTSGGESSVHILTLTLDHLPEVRD